MYYYSPLEALHSIISMCLGRRYVIVLYMGAKGTARQATVSYPDVNDASYGDCRLHVEWEVDGAVIRSMGW